jgi:hypothetical protein
VAKTTAPEGDRRRRQGSKKLEELRRIIEEMDTIEVTEDGTRELIEKRRPWLLDKIPPKKPS